MINFYNRFLTCTPNATIDDVIAHINYARDLIGPDHIGIGGDYDGVDYTPTGLEDVSKYPNLFEKLLNSGWSELELRKLAGGNILRVLQEVENVSYTQQI